VQGRRPRFPDPNAHVRGTLTAGADTPCNVVIHLPNKWIDVGHNVVVQPTHGALSFADDAHFAYAPQQGYTGKDRFAVEIDRQIRATGASAHRVVTFDVSVTRAANGSTAARALANDPIRQCLIAVNKSHPLMQGPMRGYIDETAYNAYQLDRERCLQSR